MEFAKLVWKIMKKIATINYKKMRRKSHFYFYSSIVLVDWTLSNSIIEKGSMIDVSA